MILQELIRNFILYREVVRPILESWKQSLVSGYYREIAGSVSSDLTLALNKAKALKDGEELGWDMSDEYEAMSLTQTSGTRTITSSITLGMNESDLLYEAKKIFESASVSREVCIVLRNGQVDDNIVGIGKTSRQTFLAASAHLFQNVSQTQNTTTGFTLANNFSHILETHERREYLGEFSLTHEETPLLYLEEGGEQHDIY